MREREIKLDPPAGDITDDAIDATLASVDDVRVERVEDRLLTAHYYDTDDLRLTRWGSSLRHRDDEGWTVKIPVATAGKAVVRDEVHVDSEAVGGAAQAPDAAVRLVDAFTLGAPVRHVATLVTRRRALILSTGNTALGELTDDRVRVERPPLAADSPSTGPDEFRELELEFAEDLSERGADAAADAVLEALEAIGCTPSPHGSKVARALGDAATAAPDLAVPELTDAPDARAVIQHALATSVEHLVHHLPVARLGDDPEGVHQARVALRRIRSDLRTFRPLLDRTWANDLRHRAKRLARSLGDVRDDDVHLELLQSVGAPGAIVDRVRQDRAGHREALLATLDEPDTREVLAALVAAANEPVTLPDAAEPASDALAPLIRKRWKRLRKAVNGLPDEPTSDELHQVRIHAKRCRYAVMATAPAFGDSATTFAKRLGKLQDALGTMRDDSLLAARLRDLAVDIAAADAFAAGEAAGRLTAEAQQAEATWPRRWRNAKHARPTWL